MTEFDERDLAVLREHGFVPVAGRVVYEARPPTPSARVEEIARVCAAPLPEELLALWATVGGGRLDYAVTVELDGEPQPLSWAELFGDDEPSGLALDGWLDHEIDLATDGGRVPGVLLHAVPIGGFEYLERIYVRVGGERAGEVVVWMHGLPAWTGGPTSDALATLAPDLASAFALLHLPGDPLDDDARYGREFLAVVDEQRAAGLPADLADRLVAYYRRAFAG
ncbi:hypothetical protein [Actinomycetospora termitidis]|uniref:Knr4/Smi1-like domain-containing protein n=1 Tax=Actinomycetospora termitidis TaxID=3053470 RepID=A0ABT7MH59_9PSEU|nr:hypothetical protein [Actinomycetospora sp. Odt1-22]MDL5159267.1 hypothetical protein [Actinomycetospora sp. Odt1-22]